jgi:thermitase
VPGSSFRQQTSRSTAIPGQVVVQFRSRPTTALLQQFAAQNKLQTLRLTSLGTVLFKHDTRTSTQTLGESLKRSPLVEYVHANTRYHRLFTVNDPRSSEQTGLAMIGSAKAWDLTMGDPRIVIAVIDSGVDLQHPDLQANLVPGYNVLAPEQPPQDDNGHGTHASGIAAAVTDNRTGIAGACPRCKIMPIKALDALGEGGTFEVAAGVVWAVDKGASIINLSLGGDKSDLSLERAIKYALSRNVAVVAAAGNGVPTETENGTEMIGVDTPMYPAALTGVIAVGAVDTSRNRTRFSNFGRWVTIMAPGQGILSTMPHAPVHMTTEESYQQDYDVMDGTSMAAPMVAGIIGLIKSRHPGLSPDQIKSRLEGTAIDMGAPGFDTDTAHGMIDAFRAVL